MCNTCHLQDLVDGFKCECPAGFLEPDCEGHQCDHDPCENGGTCMNTTDGFDCVCILGYTVSIVYLVNQLCTSLTSYAYMHTTSTAYSKLALSQHVDTCVYVLPCRVLTVLKRPMNVTLLRVKMEEAVLTCLQTTTVPVHQVLQERTANSTSTIASMQTAVLIASVLMELTRTPAYAIKDTLGLTAR